MAQTNVNLIIIKKLYNTKIDPELKEYQRDTGNTKREIDLQCDIDDPQYGE